MFLGFSTPAAWQIGLPWLAYQPCTFHVEVRANG